MYPSLIVDADQKALPALLDELRLGSAAGRAHAALRV